MAARLLQVPLYLDLDSDRSTSWGTLMRNVHPSMPNQSVGDDENTRGSVNEDHQRGLLEPSPKKFAYIYLTPTTKILDRVQVQRLGVLVPYVCIWLREFSEIWAKAN